MTTPLQKIKAARQSTKDLKKKRQEIIDAGVCPNCYGPEPCECEELSDFYKYRMQISELNRPRFQRQDDTKTREEN